MFGNDEGRRDDNRRPFLVESPGRTALVAAAPAMALAALLLLPFASKAFTIDDTLFLRQAEAALRDPLHPTAVIMVWSEYQHPVRLSEVMPTGPLMGWLLVPTVLAGGSEVVAHLTGLLLLLLAVLETSALALRLGYGEDVARLSALLLASTPAALAMSGTVMPDVAAMAFGLVGLERLAAWRSTGGAAAGLLAAVGLALAPLARTHLLMAFCLVPFLLGIPRRASECRRWLPVVAGALLAALVFWVTRDPQAGSVGLASAAGRFSSIGNVRSNLVAVGLDGMLLFPLGLAWLATRGRRFWSGPLPWSGVALVAGLLWWGDEGKWLWIAPASGLGLAVGVDVLRDGLGSRDRRRLLLCWWLLVALPVIVYLHFPSKYLLAAAPAAAILAASALAALPKPRGAAVASILVVAGCAFGLLLLKADATFAGLGRRAVEELVVPRVRDGERVWFNAHWGFQWYAEKAGARVVTATRPHPAPGDLVVSAEVTITGVSIEAFPRRELLATVTDDSPGGRLMNDELGAGFYSNGWGYLPWAWGNTPVDRFDLWRLH